MASGFGESTIIPTENSSSYSGGSNTNDTGDFECNICLDLAQDPIVTLCGHLFCWPCLYRWLHHHSYSQECPVCKAFIQEEKLVPLYGRGKKREDPRSKPIPGMEIPNRPSGQRPETAEPPNNANRYMGQRFGMTGGHTTARTASTPSAGYASPFPNIFHGGHGHGFAQAPAQAPPQWQDNLMKNILFLIGFIVLLIVICY